MRNDIIETQQETILANQQAILDHLNDISHLLNERAKKQGMSSFASNSNVSRTGNHSSISMGTIVADTEAKATNINVSVSFP